jgi:hypothetical protein
MNTITRVNKKTCPAAGIPLSSGGAVVLLWIQKKSPLHKAAGNRDKFIIKAVLSGVKYQRNE